MVQEEVKVPGRIASESGAVDKARGGPLDVHSPLAHETVGGLVDP